MNIKSVEYDRAQNERAVSEIERKYAPVHNRRIRAERAKQHSGSAPVKEASVRVPRTGRFNGWSKWDASTLDMLGDIFGV